ncbi:MAG TPA: heavy metal translocating P-type ATPase [Tepidisphaeraceae bacterium]
MPTQSLKVSSTCPVIGKDHHETCGQCLSEHLRGHPGIRGLRLHPAANGQSTLELDYDPRLITLGELNEEVKRAGLCLSPDRAEMVLGIDGMVSPRSEQVIEAVLSKLPGVVASASFASKSLRIEFDRNQCALPEIVRRLDELGFHLSGRKPAKPQAEKPEHAPLKTALHWAVEYHKLTMAFAGGLLLLAAYLVHKLGGPELNWLRIALIVPSYLLSGWYTFKDTAKTLWNRQFDIDVLMFAAAVGAAILGQYEAGGLLLFLFALGGAGEEMAMDRARKAIQALAKLAPETATVRAEDGSERLVRVEDLNRGDHVVVRPFDRIPADGSVVSGTSSVDQSPITGESIPVEKSPGARVFAGTINGEGLLVVAVAKLSSESTLAKIVKMVNEAQTTKSPTQVFTDQVERRYVPFVLIATALLIVIPPLLWGGWGTWFLRAMAFLTAASPCALAIGTPATVLSGIARAARGGVLVKGGVHLENLGRVNAIAFDKTGTLTRGRPEVTDVIPLNGKPTERLLALAAAVEKGSTHPLAQAIVGEAKSRACEELEAAGVEQILGKGMAGHVNGSRIVLGNVELPAEHRARADELATQGRTPVVMLIDDVPEAIIGLADRPRENASGTLARLKDLGILRTVMLTGDRDEVARAIAKEVGVDEYRAELLPQDKVTILSDLERKYGPVAMIGDGVNDAPAMATAAVGVAMGGAGTDVAMETADVALMADDLARLPDAIGLSRFSRRVILQNLSIALGVICILAPLAAMGVAQLGIAVLFHEGSTVVVVLNAMRLLVYRPR